LTPTSAGLHAHLGRITGEAVRQRRDERVDRAAADNCLDHRPPIRAQHAALVGHFNVGRVLADIVDEPRRGGAEKGILAVEPVAADVVVPGIDLRQQLRNLLGRILQVGIERDDHLAPHALERRHDRHVLPVVRVEIDHPRDLRPRGVLGPQQLERTVGTAIVGEHHLVAPAERIEHRVKPREKHRQVELLVVNGNDD